MFIVLIPSARFTKILRSLSVQKKNNKYNRLRVSRMERVGNLFVRAITQSGVRARHHRLGGETVDV